MYGEFDLTTSTQMEIQREKDRVVELTNETKKFKALKKVQNCILNSASHDCHMTLLPQEYAELQERYAALQETVSDQEIALVEMGKKLSV